MWSGGARGRPPRRFSYRRAPGYFRRPENDFIRRLFSILFLNFELVIESRDSKQK
ncbi:conserved hypothetical protein [Burkholderia mallei PRL-20]|uniref:Uncharacterized protein n=1 Tax=Burkholderia mallei (strain NCTC 10229) TaxID=412022 RepID=A2RZA9_BURM9|nr:hypothetical protein BMASAVP1_0940 [Burkholderia mallei SAVP1]ABN00530.2 hypothetical protein BMA10229_1226 [Burkholderia mallei NCTC 10229]ABO02499.1 hypothetical protein BMA10247_A2203 [Burkholderia mallei NCTC 10247]EEP87160.1 conserved hypothetical protein [Burkholderia mallei GB8 horse 4]EES46888.1 conserved hypothetical protein [Burkholderia mallei PRL-20]